MLYDVLAGYGIVAETDRVDAARFVRGSLHGFVSLEIEGGFAMSRPVDSSFERALVALDAALRAWPSAAV